MDWLKTRFGIGAKEGKREAFSGAASSRLTMDWILAPLSADAATRSELCTLRTRSRDLERNNEWVRGFLRALDNNVLGERGITLQMRVRDQNGTLDEAANSMIEQAWKQWCRVGNCTTDRRSSWRDVQRQVLRSIARDGEVLIRKWKRDGELRLQLMEADMLDQDCNLTLGNGNDVRMGVEFDGMRQVVAYHLLTRHPGDDLGNVSMSRPRARVPVSEVMHLFIAERIDQTRGFPWLSASIKGLRMLDGYAEAELVAARTASAKMGFFTRKGPDGVEMPSDSDGNLRMDASPGVIEELPMGVEFKEWSPDHPNSGYGEFVKNRLRGVATSLGISYTSLANDLEGVNYSSIRAGLLEEREVWKAIQRYLIEHFCEPVFSEWLFLALGAGRIGNLPMSKMWKFDHPEFTGRRWAWVDPKKDIEAAVVGINAGLTSQRRVAAENGADVFDIFSELEADAALAKAKKLRFPELEGGSADEGSPENPEIDTE